MSSKPFFEVDKLLRPSTPSLEPRLSKYLAIRCGLVGVVQTSMTSQNLGVTYTCVAHHELD